jgi:hypothetical protein
VTIRHLALAAGAALVLGLTVYLFVQVRSTPASAQVPPAVAQRAPAIDEETDPAPAPEVRIPPPRATPDAAAAVPAPPPEMPGKPSLGDLVRSGPANQTASGFADPKVMAVMDEANKAYDHGDFDDARAIAQRVLAQMPGNPRMLRIVVSSACIAGDSAEAQKAYLQLAPPDREQMKVRCARYGMTFKDE